MSSDFSRRKFLQTSAIAAGGLFASNAKAIALEPQTQSASSKPVGANDRLRFGIIGVGMEGSALLSNAIALPGVECVGAADVTGAGAGVRWLGVVGSVNSRS